MYTCTELVKVWILFQFLSLILFHFLYPALEPLRWVEHSPCLLAAHCTACGLTIRLESTSLAEIVLASGESQREAGRGAGREAGREMTSRDKRLLY